jgi:hypothetical protein
LKHFASSDFWECYRKLPHSIQELADTQFPSPPPSLGATSASGGQTQPSAFHLPIFSLQPSPLSFTPPVAKTTLKMVTGIILPLPSNNYCHCCGKK